MAQCFKLNMFSGFCKQVCQLFSSINMFYPDVIKVSLPHIEVSHLSVVRPFVILWFLGWFDGTDVDVQYRCFSSKVRQQF